MAPSGLEWPSKVVQITGINVEIGGIVIE